MFYIGFPELLVIFATTLIVFGPQKLSQLGKALGRAIREFKKTSEEVKESFEREAKDVKELQGSLTEVASVPLETTGQALKPTEHSISVETQPPR
jgi:sec-independent protein translocase protein TatA